MDLARRWHIALFVCLFGTTIALRADAQQSTLVVPVNGAVAIDTSIPFSWTTVAGAQAYYLYVGTAPGLKDLVNSGETTLTSYSTGPLPSGPVLYARLWTKVAGTWRYVDSTFTAAPAVLPVKASFVYPLPGAADVDIGRAFQWTPITGAQAYYLYVGTGLGLRDIYDSGEKQATSLVVPTLPGERALYARLWTKLGGVWRYVDIQFTTASVARLITPPAGASAFDGDQPFTWNALAGAQAYYLYVGTTLGAKDIVNTGEVQATSYRAASLPIGQILYARIWTKSGGIWRSVDSTFTVAAPSTARMVNPAYGQVVGDLTVPFTWTPIPGASAYYLYAGRSVGAKDLLDTGEIAGTSYVPSSLSTKLKAASVVWDFDDEDPYMLPRYALTLDGTRTDFGSLAPTSCPTPAGDAPCYRVMLPPLDPGSHSVAVSAYDDAGESLAPPIDMQEPDRVVYLRLWTKIGGVWKYADSLFTVTDLAARFVYPLAGAISVNITQPLRWSAVAGADAYSLSIGRSSGSSELLNVTTLTGTTYQIATLPGYERLYARLGTRVQGVWRYRDTTFTAVPAAAQLFSPAPGSVGVPATTWLQWTTVPDATAYYVYVGTALGAKDIINSGERTASWYEARNLPIGTLLYVRLWTKLNSVWRYVDSTFTTRGAPETMERAAFISPLQGTAVAAGAVTFQWTSVVGALGYHLHLGSVLGADDYGQSPDYLGETAYTLPVQPGKTVYVRLYTQFEVYDWDHYVDMTITTPAAGGQ